MTTILLTRPEPEAAGTAARLDALGIETVVAPLLELRVQPFHLPEAGAVAALALTSANAVVALIGHAGIAAYRRVPVYAVGDRTAAAARHAGFTEVLSAEGSLPELVATIVGARPAGTVLYCAARHQSGDLGHLLVEQGVRAATVRVYDMLAARALPEAASAALSGGGIDAVMLYSRRTAETFVSLTAPLLPAAARARLAALCISEQTAEPVLEAGFVRLALAEHPSEEAMVALALTFSREQNRS